MKKRLLSLLLALVLVLSMVPVGVIAEGTDAHIHCLCGQTTTLGTACAECGSTAAEWTATDTMPTASGNYYLTADVSAGAQFLNDLNIALCLHGHTVTSAAGKKFLYLNRNVTYAISDCTASYAADGTYTAGSFTGATGVDTYGSTMRINAGCVLSLYDGKITGNKANDDGVIYVDGSSNASTAGGTFTMYGGEVSGNTARRGAIYGVSTGTNRPVIRILGGAVTGNTGTGTSTFQGGAGIYAFSAVEVGGNAVISGNTAAAGPADIYLRNDGTFAGALVISADIPLETGAQIAYGLATAETDPTNLTFITGAPATWDTAWVSYDGGKVAYADGKFFLEDAYANAHIHCLCGAETAIGATCASCGNRAVVWTSTESFPNTEGYYFLTADVSAAPVVFSGGTNTAICLHGHTVTSAAGRKIAYISGGATLSVTDCAETKGSLTGVTSDTTLHVAAGSVLNLYSGKITGNNAPNIEGVIKLDYGTTTANGGEFNMYGGEISGNTVKRGTVLTAVATASNKATVVRILGGAITGNHATGTSVSNGQCGGAGIIAMVPIEVGGDAVISGNTAAAGPADIYIRNDQKGALVISSEKPLTSGAQFNVGLHVPETDLSDLKYVTGSPATWNTSWVTYEGEPLRYEDGKFTIAKKIVYSNHDHDGKTWISVTNESEMLPESTGYYVLDGDVTLPRELQIGAEQNVVLCLNGHTLTAASGVRHFVVQPGGTLTICDCTAVTAKDGTYTAGSITGADGTIGGGSIRIRPGATVNLYDGKITGNHTTMEGGAFYLEGCTATLTTPAVLNMYGGEISHNSADQGFGGAIRMAGAVAGQAATFHMEGGTISNNESPNYGGALHAPSGATIELLGGVIENNTAGAGGGGISVNGVTTVTLDGTIIRGNSAPKWGGGVYIKTGATMNMTAGEVSGNSAKIGAGILMESEGTTLNMQGGKISGNKVGTAGGGGIYVGTQCVMTMDGGEICGNTSEAGGAGVMCVTGTLTMNGGTICHNHSDSWGAGLLLSNNAAFTMNGGKIAENYTPKCAAGIYAIRSKLILNKGSVHNNRAEDVVGGIRLTGSTMELNGAWITSNQAMTGSGSGLMIEQSTQKVDGKTVKIPSHVVMTGGSISYNTAAKAAAGVLIQHEGCSMVMYGGKISQNHSGKFACGVYAGKGTSFSMHGGEVTYNTLDTNGVAGVFHDGGTGNHTGGEIYGNVSPVSGGGFGVGGQHNVVYAKGLKIYDNTAKVGAGVLVQNRATLHMEDCEIYNNNSTLHGAGVYMYSYSDMTMKNCSVHDNVAQGDGGGLWMWAIANLTLDNCQVTNNKAETGDGGGLWTRGDTLNLLNTTVSGNTAAGNGGGIFAGMMGSATVAYVDYIRLENTTVQNNISGKQGGAMYLSAGSKAKLYDSQLVNNTASAEGGAIWAVEDLTLRSVTISNNTSGGEGYAVYLADSGYDGHSYFAGVMKMSGDMKIHDNQGGDLYLGEKVPVIIDEALTDSARMELTMHSGLLTQWVWGSYNYEGGNQVYTITAGDRSVTEPEVPVAEEPVEEPTEEPVGEPTEAPTEVEQEAPKGNTGLIVGIAAIVLVIVAAALIIILTAKKKKSDK